MIDKLRNWLRSRTSDTDEQRPVNTRKTGVHSFVRSKPVAAPKQTTIDIDAPPIDSQTQIESTGPGKNVLTRNRFIREDTGTHETLKILDDSLLDSGEEKGIDPYNTGGFDRSKNWTNRFRK